MQAIERCLQAMSYKLLPGDGAEHLSVSNAYVQGPFINLAKIQDPNPPDAGERAQFPMTLLLHNFRDKVIFLTMPRA